MYFYIKNLQGDVVKIIDQSGAKVKFLQILVILSDKTIAGDNFMSPAILFTEDMHSTFFSRDSHTVLMKTFLWQRQTVDIHKPTCLFCVQAPN